MILMNWRLQDGERLNLLEDNTFDVDKTNKPNYIISFEEGLKLLDQELDYLRAVINIMKSIQMKR